MKAHISRRNALAGIGATALAMPHLARAQEVQQLIVITGVTPWLAAYQKTAAQYEKEKGVKIVMRPFPYGGMRTQMVNTIQSQNPVFDVFQLDEPGPANSTITTGSGRSTTSYLTSGSTAEC